MIVTKAKCRVCGKITALRQPYGEGTDFLPRRHKVNGEQCPGSVREAELVDFVNGKSTACPECGVAGGHRYNCSKLP